MNQTLDSRPVQIVMVGTAHGMDTTGYTIPYVSTWAVRVEGKDPVQVVQATGERVRKTALAILDRLDTEQIGDGTPPGLDRDAPQRDRPARRTPPVPDPREPGAPVSSSAPALAGRGL